MTPQQIDSDALLRLARSLLNQATQASPGVPRQPQEANIMIRSAVSRAYYACFSEAILRLQSRGLSSLTTGNNSHEQIWSAVQKTFRHPKDGSAAYVWGTALKKARVKCDYANQHQELKKIVASLLFEDWASNQLVSAQQLLSSLKNDP